MSRIILCFSISLFLFFCESPRNTSHDQKESSADDNTSIVENPIEIKTAHELFVAMSGGSFVGINNKDAKIRITEFSDYIRIKNYYNDSELKITDKKKVEMNESEKKGIVYTGEFRGNLTTITMVIRGDKIFTTVLIGNQEMKAIGEIEPIL